MHDGDEDDTSSCGGDCPPPDSRPQDLQAGMVFLTCHNPVVSAYGGGRTDDKQYSKTVPVVLVGTFEAASASKG